ncbi:helix-turn-helix transcriptional regulator [Paralcaligenes sp. KSB-10]|uniref:helix-turn-helix transcriptional regulator n=1 Tax=Paralcaligenes sp. KSB-10 TaxID=2901142 RepID=UPI00351D0CC3
MIPSTPKNANKLPVPKPVQATSVATQRPRSRASIPPLPESGFARCPVVAKASGVGESTIWLWVRKGKFPKPVKISERVTGWRAEQVQEFLADPQAWRLANREG